MISQFSKLRSKYKRFRSNALIVKQLESSFSSFFRREASGGLILIIVALLALVFANVSSFKYLSNFWTNEFTFSINSFTFSTNFKQIVNKVFVPIYFFVIVLELKRLLLVGELSVGKKFLLPLVAAIGAIVIPVSIYLVINAGLKDEIKAWIMLAGTDIALVACLSVFIGNAVKEYARVFIITVSIISNIIGILVLSFITPISLNFLTLFGVIILMIFLWMLNKSGFKSTLAYLFFGFLLWIFVYKSGLHPALSGVLLAIVIPSGSKINQVRLFVRGKRLLTDFKLCYNAEINVATNKQTQEIIESMSQGVESCRTPMHKLGKGLHPFAIFIILPLFILANVDMQFGNITESLSTTASVGLILALVIGKPIGILIPCYSLVKAGLVNLPKGIKWKDLIAVSFLGGISFSFSLFASNILIQNQLLNNYKLAILFASLISGILSLFLFKLWIKR